MSQTGLILPLTTLESLESCKNCRFSVVDASSDRVCRRNPPQVSLVVQPASVPRVGMELRAHTVFPVVTDQTWCGCFEPKHN